MCWLDTPAPAEYALEIVLDNTNEYQIKYAVAVLKTKSQVDSIFFFKVLSLSDVLNDYDSVCAPHVLILSLLPPLFMLPNLKHRPLQNGSDTS